MNIKVLELYIRLAGESASWAGLKEFYKIFKMSVDFKFET